jgi:hypothetical protein
MGKIMGAGKLHSATNRVIGGSPLILKNLYQASNKAPMFNATFSGTLFVMGGKDYIASESC